MDIKQYFPLLQQTLSGLDQEAVNKLIQLIRQTQAQGSFIYTLGNGGSGANASHFAQDLLKCPIKDFSTSEGRFKAICLSDNTPVIMAYGNDLGYDEIFVQQLKNFCREGDLVIGLSGSGKSKNVIKAFDYANGVKALTFAIVGFDGGPLLASASASLHIKTNNMQVYEDVCMSVLHAVVSSLL